MLWLRPEDALADGSPGRGGGRSRVAPKMASRSPSPPRPGAPPPAGPRDPARTSRPPRLATPGPGLCGRGPAPRGKRTNRREAGAGRVVTANGGGAPEGSNRLVGGGEGRRERGGTRGRAPEPSVQLRRSRSPNPSSSSGAPGWAGLG